MEDRNATDAADAAEEAANYRTITLGYARRSSTREGVLEKCTEIRRRQHAADFYTLIWSKAKSIGKGHGRRDNELLSV